MRRMREIIILFVHLVVTVVLSCAKIRPARYATSFSKLYSWCSPPRIAFAFTR